MKKVFAVLAIAGAMAACSNNSESSSTQVDSAAKTAADTVKAAVSDTTAKKVDAAVDTTKAAAADTAKKAK